jgi:hypothetical protein
MWRRTSRQIEAPESGSADTESGSGEGSARRWLYAAVKTTGASRVMTTVCSTCAESP